MEIVSEQKMPECLWDRFEKRRDFIRKKGI